MKMTAFDRRAKQLADIVKHGKRLLAIFPNALEQCPLKLCKKLRRLEGQGQAIALRLCNGPAFPGGYDEVDALCEAVIKKVDRLLHNEGEWRVPIFLNRDPRGYALKITAEWMHACWTGTGRYLHTDAGRYGILAPEIGKDGNS